MEKNLDVKLSRGGPYDFEMSSPLNFLDSRLTDGGEVTSLTRLPLFNPWKIPGTNFDRG
jgi:hypothetical protein